MQHFKKKLCLYIRTHDLWLLNIKMLFQVKVKTNNEGHRKDSASITSMVICLVE